MTNFELMMLKIAQEIQKDEDEGLVGIVCNAGNLPCSRCPAKPQCDEWAHFMKKFEAWLRQEADNER